MNFPISILLGTSYLQKKKTKHTGLLLRVRMASYSRLFKEKQTNNSNKATHQIENPLLQTYCMHSTEIESW